MIYSRSAWLSGIADIVAVAEPDSGRRERVAAEFNIPAARVFQSADALFSKGRIADAVIIASMDRDHYLQTVRAMDLKYDILLEKPISPS